MSAITGDETGLIKSVHLLRKQVSVYGEQSRRAAVLGLAWTDPDKMFGVARVNSVELWSVSSDKSLLHRDDADLSAHGDCAGVSTAANQTLLAYSSAGHVTSFKTLDGVLDKSSSFAISGPISALVANNSIFAAGGNENDLQVWDLAAQAVSWKAKNVPHDKLSLRVPVWITAIGFMRSNDIVSEHEIVTGTGYRHARLYDTRTKRQPILSIELGDYRVTSLTTNTDARSAFIGDTSGGLHLWDMRASRRLLTFNGFAGSIRSCVLGADGTAVAGAGLDRFLRVYDVNRSSNQIGAVYLKNRLNACLLFSDVRSTRGHGSGSDSDSGAEASAGEGGDGEDDSDGSDLLEAYEASSDEDEEEASAPSTAAKKRVKVEALEGSASKKSKVSSKEEAPAAKKKKTSKIEAEIEEDDEADMVGSSDEASDLESDEDESDGDSNGDDSIVFGSDGDEDKRRGSRTAGRGAPRSQGGGGMRGARGRGGNGRGRGSGRKGGKR
jgi:ribosome biogenesis protein NSA1